MHTTNDFQPMMEARHAARLPPALRPRFLALLADHQRFQASLNADPPPLPDTASWLREQQARVRNDVYALFERS